MVLSLTDYFGLKNALRVIKNLSVEEGQYD